MDGPRYRTQLRPAALNARKSRLFKRGLPALLAGLLLLVAVGLAIRKPRLAPDEPAPASPPAWVSQLAETRVETAMAKLDQGHPDEALALMVSALKADPGAADARALAEKILRETTWHFPVITIAHSLPIDRIGFAAPSSLWVSLAGNSNTTVRWNLETLRIESVLFPLPDTETRSLVMDLSHRRMVVERAGIILLCDAQSLKPVKDLGVLPDFTTPSSVIVFSADGLLMAHPALVSTPDESLVWHLRDAATGEILRSSERTDASAARPLTAFLDRRALRVLHADGSTLEIPVSPVDPITHTPASGKTALQHAQFAANGKAALVLINHGPHQAPELIIMPADGHDDGSLQPAALLERFPWNHHPGIWTGLLRDAPSAPLAVEGSRLNLVNGSHAPFHTTSPITAVAAGGTLRLVGEANGKLVIHQLLPALGLSDDASIAPESAASAAINAFENLTTALAGLRHDESNRNFIRVAADERLRLWKDCDFDALRSLFPRLDFSPLLVLRDTISPRTAEPSALQPLQERLARADSSHPDAASSKAAKLATALESVRPEWIEECLATADDLPPLLRKLAVSRIAWLEGRKADALAGWPEVFPDLAQVRLREDWDGWEQADFSQAMEKLRLCVIEELSALELPENPTPEQIQTTIKRLTDPETLRSVGRPRLAHACLKAALALVSITGEAEAALKLAMLAGNLGAPTEPCLRAEALALGALGDHQKARDRWVRLLTEHPVETHQPADYAEAAYTAFETGDPGQAMEILTTGLHRFPADADFALRAGWIALLTGNPDRAYRFLLNGRETGFAPAKLENATALLAIAAVQVGSIDDAAVFHQELIDLNPAWQDPATIEELEWPEELKSSLRQLTW
jgi:tetratricopeptide (TPR) repeat protein